MSLFIFVLVSLAVLYFGKKDTSAFLVNVLSSFFVYYFALTAVGVDLQPGQTFFIYLCFFGIVAVYLLMTMHTVITLNKLDRLYIVFCAIWTVFYLINFNDHLFKDNRVYQQAPVFLALTFLFPIVLKPTYGGLSVRRLLTYLEYIGFGASVIVLLLLLSGAPSKDVWISTEEIDWLRYAPIRGFFSNRQALLFASSTIIFVSRVCYGETSKKELFWKIPLTMISLAGIVISGSRGILVGCALICLYLLLTNLSLQKKIKTIIVISFVLVVLLGFFRTEEYAGFTTRVFSIESYQSKETGFDVRFVRYQTGVSHFLERPILGTGMSKMSAKYDYSHNIFISILEDTGIIGLMWLSAFLLFIVLHFNWKAPNKLESSSQLITRNLIFFFFLASNMYGSVISHGSLFLLLSIYYFKYRLQGSRIN